MSGKAIRETLAAIGVMASMVFVGVEIQQNTRSMQVSAYQDLMQQISALNTLGIENPEFGVLLYENDIFVRDPNTLTDRERAQFDAYLWLLLRHGDMAYYQYERGLLDDERLQSAIRPFTARLRYPLVQQEWDSRKFAFAQGYQSFVDDIIATLP